PRPLRDAAGRPERSPGVRGAGNGYTRRRFRLSLPNRTIGRSVRRTAPGHACAPCRTPIGGPVLFVHTPRTMRALCSSLSLSLALLALAPAARAQTAPAPKKPAANPATGAPPA